MKKIILTPVKNEGWILKSFLSNLSWADHIILADQHSTDETRNIANSFPNVTVIDNDYVGHTNKVRWLLLDEARKIPGEKIIFCLDADEILTKQALDWTVDQAEKLFTEEKNSKSTPVRFHYPWIQLYRDIHTYRVDGVWKHAAKTFAFVDSPLLDYPREEVINDHTERVPLPAPAGQNALEVDCPYPVLHLQYLPTARTQIKQAWYMCQEFAADKPAKLINLKYHPALTPVKDQDLRAIDPAWLTDITIDSNISSAEIDQTCIKEILQGFEEKTIAAFEPLDIWRNKTLHDYFTEHMNREPKPNLLLTRFSPFIKLMPRWIKNMIKLLTT